MTMTKQIIQRARRRERWQVERVAGNRYLVRCPLHDVVAEDLSRKEAEAVAASFNAACDDAAALAEFLRS